MAGTLSLPALDSWYNLQHTLKTYSVPLDSSELVRAFTTRGCCYTNLFVSETELVFTWSQRDFAASPVNTSNTFLYNALDFLEHVGVFFVDPVGQVATIIQDLIGWEKRSERTRHAKSPRQPISPLDKSDCRYHVGLPAFHIDTPIDAPPEVVFWFALPCKHAET